MSHAVSDAVKHQAVPMAVCLPRTDDHLALRPIGIQDVRITSGFWADWQRENRTTTIPHGLDWIEREGVLDNFRRLVGDSDAVRRGMVFADSDLYKMLEAIAWDLSQSPNREWNEVVADAAKLIERVQEPDGYINTWVQAGLDERFGDLPRGHELYCAGHLIQAAVAHARVSGEDTLLDVARPFADYLAGVFREGGRDDTDGHPEIETALVELYRHTGDPKHLALARRLIDVRGRGVLGPGAFGSAYFQDDVPVREQDAIHGHSVRALYLLAGVVDVYLETGESDLLHAAEKQWTSMVAEKTYLTGAVGSRFEGEAFGDPYELPPDLIYGETCAAIGSLMLSWRLLLATGKSKYADLIERILYNVFSASTSVERDSFFYVNPVQRRSARPAAPEDAKPMRSDAPGTRADWYDVACCPPNIMRTVASLSGYVASSRDAGVQLHQYFPSTVRSVVSGGEVTLTVSTEYPRDGRVTIAVDSTTTSGWALSMRIPDWSERFTVTVNDAHVPAVVGPDGYLVVEREWTSGDVVALELLVEARMTVPHPAVDAVRGSIAIERGPLVYCLERPTDVGTALEGETTDIDSFDACVEAELRSEFIPDLFGGTTVVLVPGRVRSQVKWADVGWSTRGSIEESTGERATLTAIPYALWANRGPSAMRVWIPATSDC